MHESPDNHHLIGLVLCGGQSTRMGTDKGLLLKTGITWAGLAYKKLADQHIPVYISIHPRQMQGYQAIFEKNTLLPDCLEVPGPLAGILSAYHTLGMHDILLLACDMTDVSASTIHRLVEVYQQQKEIYDFFVYANGNDQEPLLGIYSERGLAKVYELIMNKGMQRYSMKHVLETGSTFSLPLEDHLKAEFKNYNETKDLS